MSSTWANKIASAAAALSVACLTACGAGAGDGLEHAQLFVVGSDGSGLRQLTESDGGREAPAWAPDGSSIASVIHRVRRTDGGASDVPGAVELVSPDGTDRKELTAGGYPSSAVWVDSERLAFVDSSEPFFGTSGDAVLMSADGTVLHRASIELPPQRGTEEFSWSPDRSELAITFRTAGGVSLPPVENAPGSPGLPTTLDAAVYVASSSGGEAEPLGRTTRDDMTLAWSPSGALLYTTGKTMWIRTPADGRSHRVASGFSITAAGWSPDGQTVAYVRGFEVWSMRSDGSGKRLLSRGIPYMSGLSRALASVTWSPDGKQLLVGAASIVQGRATFSIYLVAAAGGAAVRLVDAALPQPVWSPDSRSVAFVGRDYDTVKTIRTDGSDLQTIVAMPDTDIRDLSWSPSGSQFAFTAQRKHHGD